MGIVSVFHKVFVICNPKNQFDTSNGLGNAVIHNDDKPRFLSCVANWVGTWSTSPVFTLTEQTSHAVITLRATSYLLNHLLNEDLYSKSRLQSDHIERNFSKYRQTSGGGFLVSLIEVNSSEKN